MTSSKSDFIHVFNDFIHVYSPEERAKKTHLGDKHLMSTEGPYHFDHLLQSKKISNDQELIQSDPISCPQNQKGNN